MLAVAVIYWYVERIGNQGVYDSSEDVPESQAAIVLGARVYGNGMVSPVLEDRLLRGIELYKKGKVKKILLTGDHGQAEYDEVNIMRKFVLQHGVPEEDVFMDHAGFSTYDSMYRARDIFTVKEAVIVTQNFHLTRALYIVRKLGIEAAGFSADRRKYVGMDYLMAREVLARVKAVGQVVLHAQSKYLGEVIPITGDGRVTCDQL